MDDWTELAGLARRSGRDELADRVLLSRSVDPVVSRLDRVVEALERLTTETIGMRADIHEMRRHSDHTDEHVPIPRPPDPDITQPIAIVPDREPVTSRMWSFVEDRPLQSGIFALLLAGMVAGGPQAVERILDQIIGPTQLEATVTTPAVGPWPSMRFPAPDPYADSPQPIGIDQAPVRD